MTEVLPPDGNAYFASSSLRRSPTSHSFRVASTSPTLTPKSFAAIQQQQTFSETRHNDNRSNSSKPSSSRSPSLHTSHIHLRQAASLIYIPSTSFSLDNSEIEDNLTSPTYLDDSTPDHSADFIERPPSPPKTPDLPTLTQSPTDGDSTPTDTPEHRPPSKDDLAMRDTPTRLVDYFTHVWVDEDIWASWKHISSLRNPYANRTRLANASWRQWAKQLHKLKTIPPETLHWRKEIDVTWLYGPLQKSRQASTASSLSSKGDSFVQKRPILKKRSMSEIMLQKSISTSSLLKAAVASVKAQEDMHGARARVQARRPPIVTGRVASDYGTSSMPSETVSRDGPDLYTCQPTPCDLPTPVDSDKRHIRFDNKVEQCIAIDAKDIEEEEPAIKGGSSSSEEEPIMMKNSHRNRPLSRGNSRGSISGESKTIAPLPCTTLKYRSDSPDVAEQASHSIGRSFWRGLGVSPSASQATLRPRSPSRNFFIGDDEDDDNSWEPSVAFDNRIDNPERLGAASSGMRRTPSGMFMPLEGTDDAAANRGLIGTVMDGVNTARDIAHVIWNVGWRSRDDSGGWW